MKKIKTILNSKKVFFQNTFWLLSEQVLRIIFTFLTMTFTARYLGTNNYGLLSYSIAIITLLSTITQLGFSDILVNELVKKKKNASKTLGTVVGLRLICTSILLLTMCMVLFSNLFETSKLLIIIILLQSSSLFFLPFEALDHWFHANYKSKFAAVSKMLGFLSGFITTIVLIYFEAQVFYFAVVISVQTFVNALSSYLFFKINYSKKFLFSITESKSLLSQSYIFVISGIILSLYTQADKIILANFEDVSAVGIYTVAISISMLWVFIPSSIIIAARPIITAKKNESEKQYLNSLINLYRVIIWISIFASIITLIISEEIVSILFGEEYYSAAPVINILIFSKVFALIGVVRTIWLVIEKKIKYQIYFLLIGAITSVGFNILLIPHFGLIGAAYASFIAEFISSFVAIFIFKQTRPLGKIILFSILKFNR